MLNRRPLWLCRFFAPAFLGAAVCFVTTSAWAQSGMGKAAAATAAAQATTPPREHYITESLQKTVGKADAELFGGVLEALGNPKTPLHVIAETTAEVKQASFNGAITGRTVLRGSYAGAFVSEHELTVKQDEQTLSTKTQFVSDGKTLWTYKQDEKKYTQQSLASAKAKLSDALMEASFDVAALLGAEAANGFKNAKDDKSGDGSFKVEAGLFRGVPCRVLTISNDKDKDGSTGTFRVYVGLDKRLRALQLQLRGKSDGSALTLTETIKVMEALTTPPATLPDAALFTFTPPEGAVKVEKFDE